MVGRPSGEHILLQLKYLLSRVKDAFDHAVGEHVVESLWEDDEKTDHADGHVASRGKEDLVLLSAGSTTTYGKGEAIGRKQCAV